MAMLAHVLQLVSWWIGPLVIFVVKRSSPFVAFHAAQALLWQLCLTAFWVLVAVAWFVMIFGTIAFTGAGGGDPGPGHAFYFLFILVWGGAMLAWVATLLLAILYGIKSYNGEWALYPVIGRWAQRLARAPGDSRKA